MTQDGIQFTITMPSYSKLKTESQGAGKVSIDSAAKLNAGNVNNVINAVSIDWNQAQLPNSSNVGGNLEIQRTGQLLSLINEMQKEIYTLTAAVIALSNR